MKKSDLKKAAAKPQRVLAKAPTGIQGLDEITVGGLPRGRCSLVCGGPGCGKTLLGMEFLVRGALQFGEPGVFLAFEESGEELAANVASLGFDLPQLVAQKKLLIDFIRVERSEIEETGEFDLDGLFVRLNHAIDSIGAKRVVLDTVESLFGGLPNPGILRAELRRLFRWLREKGVTTIITGERGDATLTRQGLEEYVSDCVLLLDHRVIDLVATRRLRIVKYRGSTHGTNEYPFLIDRTGFSVLPVTSLGLDHEVSTERIPSGIARLDTMLGGKGYFRGSSVLLSGTAGTGKTSMASHFAAATCARGERCLYFAFEEPPRQILRNMATIGLDLGQWEKKGLLQFRASRPSLYGLETHLATMHQAVTQFEPQVVIIDPITSFTSLGQAVEIKSMLTRLVDFLKASRITAFFTTLTHGGGVLESTDTEISSLIDTWLLVRDIELDGERNRGLYVLKSRGMAHSNQIREFRLTGHGVDLIDAYIGPGGVLTGSARLNQETKEQAARLAREQELEAMERVLERKREALQGQIAALKADFAAAETESLEGIRKQRLREQTLEQDRLLMASRRQVDAVPRAPAKAQGRRS
jgi:circadian clock protein KaiC